jgi:hypothetical protein
MRERDGRKKAQKDEREAVVLRVLSLLRLNMLQ